MPAAVGPGLPRETPEDGAFVHAWPHAITTAKDPRGSIDQLYIQHPDSLSFAIY